MDRAIQKTDDDAASSKFSAVNKGYYADDYLRYFCPHASPPRLPLINIGTYCRVKSIDALVDQFLEDTKSAARRAIVSLGAGSDTRPFHIVRNHAHIEYHELDFTTRTTKKAKLILTTPELREALDFNTDANASDAASSPLEIHSQAYHLYGVDLRTFGKPNAEISLPLQELFAQRIPTLLLSECCLCYMSPADSDGVLSFFAENLPQPLLYLAMYEPIRLSDEFGRVMAENLAMRGLSLPGFQLYNTLEAQTSRVNRFLGSSNAAAVDIETVYDKWLSAADQQRISRLEFLDEVEEMRLLMRHYCVAWLNGRPAKPFS